MIRDAISSTRVNHPKTIYSCSQKGSKVHEDATFKGISQVNRVHLTGNQHKSRQAQKGTRINVGRENRRRHAIGTKGGSSQIVISANREHQAQENVYT